MQLNRDSRAESLSPRERAVSSFDHHYNALFLKILTVVFTILQLSLFTGGERANGFGHQSQATGGTFLHYGTFDVLRDIH